MKNLAEEYLKMVNEKFFLREFTFSKNEFYLDQAKEVELADSLVWIDDIFIAIQAKERQGKNPDDLNWFKNKVLNKAKKQLKKTVEYLDLRQDKPIEIQNGRGYRVNLSLAPLDKLEKIIVYLPRENFPEEYRFRKFYDSSDVGLIHLFHFEDYSWLCRYLITPAEIHQYLLFRKDLLIEFNAEINAIPEQLVLGMYLSGEEIKSISQQYQKYLTNLDEEIHTFDISGILHKYYDTLIDKETFSEGKKILKELAKLNRFELYHVRKRLDWSIETANSTAFQIPSRVYFERTGIGIVFIPIPKENPTLLKSWKTALLNYTFAHKYDQKSNKCIGLVLFQDLEEEEYYQLFWVIIEEDWVIDPEMEEILKTKFPFRSVQREALGGYKMKKDR
jgi:hypothetical protein